MDAILTAVREGVGEDRGGGLDTGLKAWEEGKKRGEGKAKEREVAGK